MHGTSAFVLGNKTELLFIILLLIGLKGGIPVLHMGMSWQDILTCQGFLGGVKEENPFCWP